MSTHDMNLANAAGATFRADLNLALLALVSKFSSATEPSDTWAYMWWYDTSNNILKIRNADDDAWINVATFNQSTDTIVFNLAQSILDTAYDASTWNGETDTAPSRNAVRDRFEQEAKAVLTAAGDILFASAANTLARLAKGTEGQALVMGSAVPEWGNAGFYDAYLKYSHTVASGVASGGFTSGSWQTRTINTEDTDTAGIGSLSSNQITLPAGDYIVSAVAAAYRCNNHKLKLVDVTNTTDLLIGIMGDASTTAIIEDQAHLGGKITVASDTVLELQHRCNATQSNNGFGQSPGFGVNEVFLTIEFWRLI